MKRSLALKTQRGREEGLGYGEDTARSRMGKAGRL